jgi:putative ABC transport system substrate-binding protein
VLVICTFGVLLTALAFLLPVRAEGQPQGKSARVALLDDFLTGRLAPARHRALLEGLRDLGWVEGRNLVIESRYAERVEQRREIAEEMERLKPDVIVACSPCAFLVAPFGEAPIKGIPIVFVAVSDPVAAGMAASLARPGSTMTGLSYLGIELNVKRLQILKEALPAARRVGVLLQKDHPLHDRMLTEIQAAASSLQLTLQIADVGTSGPPAALDAVFETMAKGQADAILVLQGPHFLRERSRLASLSVKYRLPGFFDLNPYAEAGGFLAYGTNLDDLWRRAAGYVDKILRGAKPADLPIQQPTKFDLVINLKTAKALGLTIPPSLLQRADQVIE